MGKNAVFVDFERWLSKNKAKRRTEIFFFFYSFTWIFWCLCILVPFKLYDRLDRWGYLAIGLLASLPCILLPFWFEDKSDSKKPLHQRYWFKANVWIAIFSFVGNYFWTHYFYDLLGASYTFPAHRLNDVPITLYFMTHAYFCFYHSISNMMIRRARNACRQLGVRAQNISEGLVVFVLAYLTAYGETITIAHFPYYEFVDRSRMYTIGSLFYAVYFFVSFPMFYRMDEGNRSSTHFSLWRSVIDSLGASMLVTLLLDFWRISFGAIVSIDKDSGLPWNH